MAQKITSHSMVQLKCPEHNEPFIFVCINTACGNFRPLCDQCIKQVHNTNCHKGTSDPSPEMIKFETMQYQLTQLIARSKDILEKQLDKTSEALKMKSDQNLQVALWQIDEIQQEVNQIIEDFRDKIKVIHKQRVKRVDDDILSMFEDLRECQTYCQKNYDKQYNLETLKEIYQLDLDYQVKYKIDKAEALQQQKEQLEFKATVVEDFKIKFYSQFRQNLTTLIQIEGPYQTDINQLQRKATSIPQQGYQMGDPFEVNEEALPCSDQMNQAQNKTFKNCLFYFQPKTKFLFLFDVSKLSKNNKPNFEKIILKINEDISIGHSSIYGPDGNIYITGGQSEKMNQQNEYQFQQIMRYDHQGKTLLPQAKMITLRHSFGSAVCKEHIYFVGGKNYKEGSLMKCEKYNVVTQKVIAINFLNHKSWNHSVTNWKDRYIFKFGGLRHCTTAKISVQQNLFERYHLEFDYWEKWSLKDDGSQQNAPNVTWMNGCATINENIIIVFGGKNEVMENQKQTFLISNKPKVSEDDETAFIFIEKNTKQLPVGAYFIESPVIFQKSLFCLAYFSDAEKKVLSFDSKGGWKYY